MSVKFRVRRTLFLLMAGILGGSWTASGASPELVFKFDFGPGPVQPGYLRVLQTTSFSPSLGYGFADITKVTSRDRGSPNALIRDFCLPNGTPFLVNVPNGEYSVTVISGDQFASSSVAVRVKGETKLNLAARAGQFSQGTFVVEVDDGQLALNFAGLAPRINSLEISRVLKFDFGPGATAAGYTNVLQTAAYDSVTGYGFMDITKVASRDRGTPDPLLSDFCLPNGTPFRIDLPNGKYTVTFSTGDQIGSTRMGVSANGLPQFYSFGAPAGKYITDSFPIVISDGQLNIEGTGSTAPHFNALTVTRIADDLINQPITVFVVGDSTVSDYNQYFFPQAGWGQMLGSFFDRNVVVDNLAERGASSKSFFEERWVETVLNRIKPNDYLLIQWGINDRANDARHTDPFTTFEDYLALYVDAARQRGAIPVLITSQNRRSFDANGVSVNGYGNYPEATRQAAARLDVPLIDLNAKSLALFTQYGVEGSKSLFLWLEAGQYPNFPNGAQDNVHFQELGARELARLVINGIAELKLQPLSLHIQ